MALGNVAIGGVNKNKKIIIMQCEKKRGGSLGSTDAWKTGW